MAAAPDWKGADAETRPTTPPGPRVTATVDARAIHASGIGRYLREVLRALLVDERFSHVRLLGTPRALMGFTEEAGVAAGRLSIVEFPASMYSRRVHTYWLRLRLAARSTADVAFCPHYYAPIVSMPSLSVVTAHDLIHFNGPRTLPRSVMAMRGVVSRRAVGQVQLVLADSDSTRQDLTQRFPSIAQEIRVVPLGVSDYFLIEGGALDADEKRLVDFEWPYLLCVGNRKPHKNLLASVETLGRLATAWTELRLVAAGRSFAGWQHVLEAADRLKIRARLVELERVSDAQLRQLYRRCEALLFPSLCEGFGLPILEAMACGAPVIASNRTSIPEVAGGAAILVDPHDYTAMAEAVCHLRTDADFRRTLIARGRARAKACSWEAAARATVGHLYDVTMARALVRHRVRHVR